MLVIHSMRRQQTRTDNLLIAACCYILHLTCAHPTEIRGGVARQPLEERQAPQGGITIMPGKCSGGALTAMQNAILDSSYLAGAGLATASNFTADPFAYFFKSDISTANTVADIFHRVQERQLGQGGPIQATCEDVYNQCGTFNDREMEMAYAAIGSDPSIAPIIVFCPWTLTMARNPIPCTQNPGAGAFSLGALMLHEIVHAASFTGSGYNITDQTRGKARDINQALESGIDTTTAVSAYMQLGSCPSRGQRREQLTRRSIHECVL